jgi:hypothetical protein
VQLGPGLTFHLGGQQQQQQQQQQGHSEGTHSQVIVAGGPAAVGQ